VEATEDYDEIDILIDTDPIALGERCRRAEALLEDQREGAAQSGRLGEGLKILVCGSRDWAKPLLIHTLLDGFLANYEALTIIHGAARGADDAARVWAQACPSRVTELAFPADWATHGKAAGPIRNQQMLDQGRPELVLAFKDNFNWQLDRGGTENMVKIAHKAGIPTYVVSRTSTPNR
jgi:hypothetical protein